MMDNKGINYKKTFFLLLLFVQMVEYPLFSISEHFKVIDEAIALVSLLYLFFAKTISKAKFLHLEVIFLYCFGIVNIIGVISNIVFRYQVLPAVLGDMAIFSKCLLGYFLSRFMLRGMDISLLVKPILRFCKFFSVLLFTVLVTNLFLEVFPCYTDIRFWYSGNNSLFSSQQLFFGHPTYLGSTCVMLISLMIGIKSKDKKNNIPYIILCGVVAISTFRFKVLAFLIICPVLIYYSVKNKRFSKIVLIIAVAAGLLFSYHQIDYYYIDNSGFSRSILTRTSVSVANDHFPLGAGFGTYGSHQSGVYYSPVYKKYGLNKIWGLSLEYPEEIVDTYWPMIIGQFGYFGLIFFSVFVIVLAVQISKLAKLGYNYFYSSLALFGYILISSTSESSFSQPFSVLFMYIIGMYTSQLSLTGEYEFEEDAQIKHIGIKSGIFYR
ncbi:MAG: hypothetical protein ACOX7R_00885 [Acetivibrionales bacterium]